MPTVRLPDTFAARALLVAVVTAALLAPAAASAGRVEQPEVDNTVTRVHVYENGSARWTVQVRTRLDTDEEAADYRAFQERVRDNASRYLQPFHDRMTRVVAAAANATGREMQARGFRLSTSIQEVPRRWGVVTYSFTWPGFAATDGDALAVGDVFQGGFFLADGDRLQVVAPDGYAVERAVPDPDETGDGRVTWFGRLDFADEHPHVRLVPASNGSNATTTTPAAGSGDGAGVDASLLAAAAVVLVAGAAGGYVALSRRGGEDGAADSDLVTDEERVRSLLADRDGRMRQADIAEDLGWSASKTSRVVSGMVEDGVVEKTRLGRENVVDLVEDGNR
jgi:uncharacterized membrane protein